MVLFETVTASFHAASRRTSSTIRYRILPVFDGSLRRQVNRTVSERDSADALTALRQALARMDEDLDDDPLFARFCETLRQDGAPEGRRASGSRFTSLGSSSRLAGA